MIPAAATLIPTGLVQAFTGPFVPIFIMHRFNAPDRGISGQKPDELRRSLAYARKHKYNPITLGQLAQYSSNGQLPPKKSVVFTIDDGFIDQYEVAAPLFEEFDIPLTYFLITDLLDGKLWPWDDQLRYLLNHAPDGYYKLNIAGSEFGTRLADPASRTHCRYELYQLLKSRDNTNIYNALDSLYQQTHVEKPDTTPGQYQPMSWDQARDLTNRGHCIGAHSRTHRILSQLSDEDAAYEIKTSIALTRERIPATAPIFAYPTGRPGDFTEREMRNLQQEGISLAVSTKTLHYKPVHSADKYASYQVPRLNMPSSLAEFIQSISWIDYLRQPNH